MKKKGQNKSNLKSVILKCTITEEQEKVIKNLIGLLGTNKQDVAGKIITLWLYQEGYLKLKNKKKKK